MRNAVSMALPRLFRTIDDILLGRIPLRCCPPGRESQKLLSLGTHLGLHSGQFVVES
jgi:hypothetical protein